MGASVFVQFMCLEPVLLCLHIKCGEEWSRPADLSTAQATSLSDALPHLLVSLDTQQQSATRLLQFLRVITSTP